MVFELQNCELNKPLFNIKYITPGILLSHVKQTKTLPLLLHCENALNITRHIYMGSFPGIIFECPFPRRCLLNHPAWEQTKIPALIISN
jgi:hypothetical protein